MQPDVAIVVVTYNSERFLPDLLASLREHTRLDEVALIIVENASPDGTLAALERAHAARPDFILLPQAVNGGYTGGNNVGLAKARTLGARYALLLNPDTVVTAGWLEPLVRVMEARPEVAAAQPLLLLWDDQERINSAGNEIHFCGFGYCAAYNRTIDEAALGDEVRSVAYATGAALLLRLAALDEVGDFDELLFLYHDDFDLQVRLRLAGYECVLVPTARVFHKYDDSFSARKYGWMERNRLMVLVKDWPLPVLLATSPVLAAVELAVVATAVKNGWWSEKLRGYRDLVKEAPALLAARARVQAARRSHDLGFITGRMQLEGYEQAVVTKVTNPLLDAYWRIVRRAIARG